MSNINIKTQRRITTAEKGGSGVLCCVSCVYNDDDLRTHGKYCVREYI